MKIKHLLLLITFTLPLIAADSPPEITKSVSSVDTNGSHEEAKLKVLKVLYAKDGDFTYRAYLVIWKDQEVVVPDTLVRTNYQVGDIARVLVMKHQHPKGKQESGLLGFEIL